MRLIRRLAALSLAERAGRRAPESDELVLRARSRAEIVLAAIATPVVVTSADGRILTANPAADRVLGKSRPLAGQLCASALAMHLGERPLTCDSGCELLALAEGDTAGQADGGGRPPARPEQAAADHETWRLLTDGDRQPLLVSVSAVPAADGPGVEVVHSIRDISRLKQADEAKTLFLATASHELKTPLTVINGFAKTLTTRALSPDKQREALAAIRRRGEELDRVVDRLLLSSRIEAGRAEVSLTAVDLIPIVYERAAGLGTATERLIEVDLPDDLPPVYGDKSAVTTVIDHLLDNAVKYSPGGEPVLVRGHSEAVAVVLEVIDAGVGMDAETAARCFDKFWQADASGTRRFGGTGIGLYIARSLVEAMGGSLTVSSTAGSGSTFSIRLAAATPEPVMESGASGPPDRRGQ